MEMDENKYFTYKKCCMPQCRGLRYSAGHHFPRSRKLFAAWAQALRMPHLLQVADTQALFICGRHFSPDDYVSEKSKTLNHNAVPRLNLKTLDELHLCRPVDVLVDRNIVKPRLQTRSRSMASMMELSAKSRSLATHEQLASQSLIEPLFSPLATSPNVDLSMHMMSMPRAPCLKKSLDTLHSTPLTTRGKLEMVTNDVLPAGSGSFMTKVFPSNIVTPSPNSAGRLRPAKKRAHMVTFAVDVPVPLKIKIEPSEETSSREAESEPLFLRWTVNGRILEINHDDLKDVVSVDFYWLRSQCRCIECFDINSYTSKVALFDFTNLSIKSMKFVDDTKELEVQWSDDHSSRYSLKSLTEMCSLRPANDKLPNYLVWVEKHTKFRDDFRSMQFSSLMCFEGNIQTAIDRLQRAGILVIENIGSAQRTVMDELIVRKLFPDLQLNLLKETRSDFVKAQKLPVTNCTFKSSDSALQVLSLAPDCNQNVEITLVDGFSAADQIWSNCVIYNVLCNFQQRLMYEGVDGYKHAKVAPLIESAGETIQRINYNPYRLNSQASHDIAKFADALQKYTDVINDRTRQQWCFTFKPDMMIILDNWRICWHIANAKPVAGASNENHESVVNGNPKTDTPTENSTPEQIPKLDCIYIDRKDYLNRLYTMLKK